MSSERLHVIRTPRLAEVRDVGPCMIVGFGGWMDGGEVSTGVVKWLADQLAADPVASVDCQSFQMLSFPGEASAAAAVRPHVNIDKGLVDTLQMPTGTFYAAENEGLLLYEADEPQINWDSYAELLLGFAQRCGVERVIYAGSFAGMVPHTRQPRLFVAAGDQSLLEEIDALGMELSNYEGPTGFGTYLLTRAGEFDMRMMTIACELPPYVQGLNPRCLEAVIRKIAAMLDLTISADELRHAGDNWEKQITRAVRKRIKLTRHIHKLEEEYDHNVFHTQMPDLKAWLKQQGLRVD